MCPFYFNNSVKRDKKLSQFIFGHSFFKVGHTGILQKKSSLLPRPSGLSKSNTLT